MAEPILIWGAGAIGGTLGACWARAGIAVQRVDVDAEHVEACRSRGLSVHGPVEDFRVRVPARTPDELTGTFEHVVLAVKAHHTAAALEALAPHLAEDGYVLSPKTASTSRPSPSASARRAPWAASSTSAPTGTAPATSSTVTAARWSSARSMAASASARARCTGYCVCSSPMRC